MASSPLPTLAPTIESSGIVTKTYAEILLSLMASFRAIYGEDVYLEADSQDGQWLSVIALAIYDCGQMAAGIFRFSQPTYAQGENLSALAIQSGIVRLSPSHSTATGTIIGQPGLEITEGTVQDLSGNLWNLPTSVTIPGSGEKSVTVTAQSPGAITADIGSIRTVNTRFRGWDSFSNTTAALPGSPVETDSALRHRMRLSNGLAATTTKASMLAAVLAVSGSGSETAHATILENDTSALVGSLPPHSVCVITSSVDSTAIIKALGRTKPPGCQLVADPLNEGYIEGTYTDRYGIPTTIRYLQLSTVPIAIKIQLRKGPGYIPATETLIKETVSNFINTYLDIGDDVIYYQIKAIASLMQSPEGRSFTITLLSINRSGGSFFSDDVGILYSEMATCTPDSVTITIL